VDAGGAARRVPPVQPGDNIEPSRRTDVLIGYDRRALYLAFRAHDTSTGVRATIARRDAIEDDDIVGVYLDTFQDHRRAYYIFFNPYGIQADGIYTDGAAEPDLTVDLVIESKGTVDSGGYTVEAAIPFASLRYRSGESPVFGLHVQRFIRRDRNEQISWMPLSRTDRVCSIRPGGWASSPTSAKGDSSSSSAPSSARRLDRRRRPAFTRDKSIPSRAFAKRCLEGTSRLAR
jgi:hypothetical protein